MSEVCVGVDEVCKDHECRPSFWMEGSKHAGRLCLGRRESHPKEPDNIIQLCVFSREDERKFGLACTPKEGIRIGIELIDASEKCIPWGLSIR